MKAAPPLVPAQKGNFQMAPKPIAELAEARMNPNRELQAELDVDDMFFPIYRYLSFIDPFHSMRMSTKTSKRNELDRALFFERSKKNACLIGREGDK